MSFRGKIHFKGQGSSDATAPFYGYFDIEPLKSRYRLGLETPVVYTMNL